jgi:hypothetical protein
MTFPKYLQRIGMALSILLNVILGGKSNQSFSARNWDWKLEGKPNLVWLIDKIFWFDQDHCQGAWEFWFVIQQHYIDKNLFR